MEITSTKAFTRTGRHKLHAMGTNTDILCRGVQRLDDTIDLVLAGAGKERRDYTVTLTRGEVMKSYKCFLDADAQDAVRAAKDFIG